MTSADEVMRYRVAAADGSTIAYAATGHDAAALCLYVEPRGSFELLTMPRTLGDLLAKDARERAFAELEQARVEQEKRQREADAAAITQVTRNTAGPCMRVSRDGREVTVEVPAGTVVRVSNQDTGETSEVRT